MNIEEQFLNIDTPEKAYFLGFLYSDGNNYRGKYGNIITIKIHKKDRKILEDFKKQFSIQQKILEIEKQNQVSLRLQSKKISDIFLKLGVVPRKSLILKFPTEDQVPSHLLNHFIRGYFDGDGSVCLRPSRPRLIKVNIVGGSSNMMEGLYAYFLKNNISCKINSEGGYYRINFYSKESITNLYNLMYGGSSGLYLERKYKYFVNFLNNKDNESLCKKPGVKKVEFSWPSTIFCSEDVRKIMGRSLSVAQARIKTAVDNKEIFIIKTKGRKNFYGIKWN